MEIERAIIGNQAETSEQKEARRFLVDLAKEATREIVQNNEVLDTVRRGELSPEQWQTFAEQRYLAAIPFEDLLRAGVEKAREMGDEELASTLEENLRDEMGIDENGVQNPEKSHTTWRRDFYKAIGVDEATLKQREQLTGTEEYSRTLQDLINKGDAVAIAGALLVLEASIPAEFKKIKDGRDKTFAETFVDQPNDSEEIKVAKAKARLYLDDHISHDAASHYPDLLKALGKYAYSQETAARVQFGAHEITNAKRKFYASLEEKLLSPKP